MTRLRALVVALLLCAVVACEDEPTPDIADPTPSSSAPSPSESESSPTATATPEALTPEETVRAWVEAQNLALRTGNTTEQRALASEDCLGCDNFSEPIESVYQAGGSYQGGEWRLVSTNVDRQDDLSAKLSGAVRIAAGTTILEEGAAPQAYEASSHLMRFELVREDEGWRFSVIAFIS
ncbi:DUF6318 family protein [Nocardioides dilutus]